MAKEQHKPIGMVPLTGCRCRCGHEWLPRGDEKPASALSAKAQTGTNLSDGRSIVPLRRNDLPDLPGVILATLPYNCWDYAQSSTIEF